MNEKANLLSIGDMSKHTGVAIKSLRYYERVGVLKPTYTDPDTGYRYYSLDQRYLVHLIMLCIQLDIPLKEMSEFIDSDDKINFRKFLTQGKKIAENKMQALKRSLKFFELIEQDLDLTDMHKPGQIYTRKIPEKFFIVEKCPKPIKDMGKLEVASMIANIPFDAENHYEYIEMGYMYEYSPAGVEYYVFAEIPKRKKAHGMKIIPAGNYFCCLNEADCIDNAPEIFQRHLAGTDSFLAIEAEVIAAKFDISKPLGELRVLSVKA